MSKNMTSKIYVPIGETFSLHGRKFQCIADAGSSVACYKCAFHCLEPDFCNSVSCLTNERHDKEKVIFIKA